MSIVDFHEARVRAAQSSGLGPLPCESEDAPLSPAERLDVLDILESVGRMLVSRSGDGAGLRKRLDAVAASLVDLLDAMDGDCDAEPSLGASEAYDVSLTNWNGHALNGDDREEDDDAEPDFAPITGGAGA